jgi:hypothetical protein
MTLSDIDGVTGKLTCTICLDAIECDSNSLVCEAMVSLWNCGHYFCKNCFIGYCRSEIREGKTNITCPYLNEKNKKCAKEISYDNELKFFLDEATLALYEKFMLKNFSKTNGCVTCPNCDIWFVEVKFTAIVFFALNILLNIFDIDRSHFNPAIFHSGDPLPAKSANHISSAANVASLLTRAGRT